MKPEAIEYWDLFEARTDKFVKTIQRAEMLIPPHLYHKTVEVVPTDGKGYLLVTRRALTKIRGGGDYEFPSGSVISGENYTEAAARELKEETGLTAINLFKTKIVAEPGIRRMVFIALVEDLHTANIQLQEEEIIGYKIVTFEQWLDLMASGRFTASESHRYPELVFNRIEKHCGVPAKEEIAPKPIKIREASLHTDIQPKELIEELPETEEEAPSFVAESPVQDYSRYDLEYESINPLTVDFSMIEECIPEDEESS